MVLGKYGSQKVHIHSYCSERRFLLKYESILQKLQRSIFYELYLAVEFILQDCCKNKIHKSPHIHSTAHYTWNAERVLQCGIQIYNNLFVIKIIHTKIKKKKPSVPITNDIFLWYILVTLVY